MRCTRRNFIRTAAAGGLVWIAGPRHPVFGQSGRAGFRPVSPGCRTGKVKVARLFLGTAEGLWPKPNLNFQEEMESYRRRMENMPDGFGDVDFAVDALVTSAEQAAGLKARLAHVDGILVIHLSIGMMPTLREVLGAGKPTVVFAVPYSGHEWVQFGRLMREPLGSKLDCILSSDTGGLALAVRPFRAIHHLRDAKILNVTTRDFSGTADAVKAKFGTAIVPCARERVLDAYATVSDADARREADAWIRNAEAVVEPSDAEIVRSCKLALALERLVDAEGATALTIDCYGTMWNKTILLPAYPCYGFSRLNDLGWGGICESDLGCAVTHALFQGLTGRPGFVSDPTVDESDNRIVLAHCLGSTKMDGPRGPSAPYKIRDVMERREGVVPQVQMRVGQKVTQGILIGTDRLAYFTGTIADTPVRLENDRGCRTQIAVKVDGDVGRLWKQWTGGLHRQTVYGDIVRELGIFCRFMDIQLVNEAV
jgi:hypothetical protein